jgi:hypothetical protein
MFAFVGTGALALPSSEGIAVDPILTTTLDLPEGNAMLFFHERAWADGEFVEVDGGVRGAAFIAVQSGAISINGTGGTIDAQIADLEQQASTLTPYDYRDAVLKPGDRILVQRGALINAFAQAADTRALVMTIDPDPRLPGLGGNDISTSLFGTPEPPPPAGAPIGEGNWSIRRSARSSRAQATI